MANLIRYSLILLVALVATAAIDIIPAPQLNDADIDSFIIVSTISGHWHVFDSLSGSLLLSIGPEDAESHEDFDEDGDVQVGAPPETMLVASPEGKLYAVKDGGGGFVDTGLSVQDVVSKSSVIVNDTVVMGSLDSMLFTVDLTHHEPSIQSSSELPLNGGHLRDTQHNPGISGNADSIGNMSATVVRANYRLRAVDRKTGILLWETKHSQYDTYPPGKRASKLSSNEGSPSLPHAHMQGDKESGYAAYTSQDGIFHLVDKHSGKLLWQHQLTSIPARVQAMWSTEIATVPHIVKEDAARNPNVKEASLLLINDKVGTPVGIIPIFTGVPWLPEQQFLQKLIAAGDDDNPGHCSLDHGEECTNGMQLSRVEGEEAKQMANWRAMEGGKDREHLDNEYDEAGYHEDEEEMEAEDDLLDMTFVRSLFEAFGFKEDERDSIRQRSSEYAAGARMGWSQGYYEGLNAAARQRKAFLWNSGSSWAQKPLTLLTLLLTLGFLVLTYLYLCPQPYRRPRPRIHLPPREPSDILNMKDTNNVGANASNCSDGKENSLAPESPPVMRQIPPAFPSFAGSRLRQDFETLQRLGKGAFGTVIKVRNRLDLRTYAVKLVDLAKAGGVRHSRSMSGSFSRKLSENEEELGDPRRALAECLREVRLLARLEHENVCRYHCAWIERTPTNNGTPLAAITAAEFSKNLRISGTSSNADASGSLGSPAHVRGRSSMPLSVSRTNLGDILEGIQACDSGDEDLVLANSPPVRSRIVSARDMLVESKCKVESEEHHDQTVDKTSSPDGETCNEDDDTWAWASHASSIHTNCETKEVVAHTEVLFPDQFAKFGTSLTQIDKRPPNFDEFSPHNTPTFDNPDISQRPTRTPISPSEGGDLGSPSSPSAERKQSPRNSEPSRHGKRNLYPRDSTNKSERFISNLQRQDSINFDRHEMMLPLVQGIIRSSSSDENPTPSRVWLCIQMQFCGQWTLRHWLDARREQIRRYGNRPASPQTGSGLSQNDSFYQKHMHMAIFVQVVRGLKHIHSKGIIHRDLKPDNIFLTRYRRRGSLPDTYEEDAEENPLRASGDDRASEKKGHEGSSSNKQGIPEVFLRFDPRDIPGLVIGDFGLSVDAGSDGRLSIGVGTPCYMSPEQTRSRSYGPASDIFSLGIILYEMVADWKTGMERHLAVDTLRRKHKIDAKVVDTFPEEARLILNMTSKDSEKRMDARAILNDSFTRKFLAVASMSHGISRYHMTTTML